MGTSEIEVTGLPNLEKLARSLPEVRKLIAEMLSDASADFANRTVSTIKRDYLSGGPDRLKVRTGRLRSSIRYLITERPREIDITFGTDVPYAAIHEFGGTTRPHKILPRKKAFLRFTAGGRTIFSRGVNHPGSVIPERSFLRPGVADEEPKFREEILALLERAAMKGLE